MTQPLPVLHVINGCGDGSISRIIERIMRYAPPGEFEWHICPVKFMGDFAPNFEALGARVSSDFLQPDPSSSSSRMLNQYIQDHAIRVVHSHTPRTIFEVWRALHWSGHSPKPGAMHLATKHLLTRPKDRKWGLLITLYDRFTLYLPDHLVPVSRTMAREICAQPGIRTAKVTAIPNAIPVADYYRPAERQASRTELGLSPHQIAIGYTGRLSKVKSLDLLLDAFSLIYAQFPQARLFLAGEGDLRPALEAQAQRLGIADAVSWLGFCSNIPHLLAAFDIYVQTSVNEGLSLSILEALAAGKPVIATRVGSADEIIQDGKTGLLIPPGSVQAIATALTTLLSNAELRTRLAKQGKNFIFEEYNIQKMVDGYLDLYRMFGKKAQS